VEKKSRKIEQLTNCASVGIIYRASDPSQVFLEIKDAGYPRKVFVGMGCLIGGNWAGEAAKNDLSPIDTFRREVEEELSFENALVDPIELKQLHDVTDLKSLDIGRRRSNVTPIHLDLYVLKILVKTIKERAAPYRVHIVTVPERVFRRGESKYSKGDVKTLVSYYTIGLAEFEWAFLAALHQKFGNLSNESITLITSLDEIVEMGFQVSWGHDQALRMFFLDHGFEKARKMAMVPGITTRYLGQPANSYKTYLERFKFLVCPFKEW